MTKELGKIKRIEFGFREEGLDILVFVAVLSTPSGDCLVTDLGKPGKDGSFLIKKAMLDAKRQYLSQMVNIPVEITFNENERVESWRVLTEVL